MTEPQRAVRQSLSSGLAGTGPVLTLPGTGDADGVVGLASGSITYCPSVERTSATGAVTDGATGGLVGDDDSAAVANPYLNTNATGRWGLDRPFQGRDSP